jgi:hypothetical protein
MMSFVLCKFSLAIVACFILPTIGLPQAPQRRVLVLGDSHVQDALGPPLVNLFQGSGTSLEVAGQRGRNPSSYRGLDSLLERHRNSDLIVAEFGDNMANYAGAYGSSLVRDEMEILMAALARVGRLSPNHCMIVTPTYGEPGRIGNLRVQKSNERLAQVVRTMRETVAGRCTFVDSRTLPRMRNGAVITTDSVHPTREWGDIWARGLHQRINSVINPPAAPAREQDRIIQIRTEPQIPAR